MRYFMFIILASLLMTSCYKNECHLCITQITRNGITQPQQVEKTYCGLTKKEIRAKKTSYERRYYDSTEGRNVYELTKTDCDIQ
ncbi:hypothetical protein GCM10023093_18910 [Nemorincola caseinilytica]|uniref:Lipoprotein n=1 Tax=Nemorincola caseinilytica TaxID=2054315 RepID=A0ABP8NI97_9BACT